MPRLLLLEFLLEDPVVWSRSDDFPFLQGLARQQGAESLWLALEAGVEVRGEGFGPLEMPGPQGARLLEQVRDFAPSLVITNQPVGPGLQAALQAAAPDAALLTVPENAVELGGRGDSQPDPATFLQAPHPFTAGAFLNTTPPDFSGRVLNPGALTARQYVPIIVQNACPYRRPLAANPHFAGLDLSQAERTTGCSFCQGSGEGARDPHQAPAVELALAQVRAHLATAPLERRTGRFRFIGRDLFARSPELLRRALQAGLPPSEFHFACRVDEFLARAEAIAELLPALEAGGHSYHIWQIGLENFSPRENDRFNKGIRPEQVFAAHERLAALERDWPRSFFFTSHGGFALILFTPWTELEDLEANLRGLERIQYPPDSLMVASRLQLVPGAPITLLARRDGLAAESFADVPFLAFPCVRSACDQLQEVPWRFRRPEVDAVYRLLIRTEASPLVPPDDPLLGRMAAIRASLPRGEATRKAVLARLVAAARALGDAPVTPEALLASFEQQVRQDARRLGWFRLRSLAERLFPLLQRTRRLDPPPFAGFQVARAWTEPQGDADVTPLVELVQGDQRLVLILLADGPGQPAFARLHGLRLCHRDDTPIDTPSKRRAVGVFVQFLKRYRERLGLTA
jgi:hypothetical protein